MTPAHPLRVGQHAGLLSFFLLNASIGSALLHPFNHYISFSANISSGTTTTTTTTTTQTRTSTTTPDIGVRSVPNPILVGLSSFCVWTRDGRDGVPGRTACRRSIAGCVGCVAGGRTRTPRRHRRGPPPAPPLAEPIRRAHGTARRNTKRASERTNGSPRDTGAGRDHAQQQATAPSRFGGGNGCSCPPSTPGRRDKPRREKHTGVRRPATGPPGTAHARTDGHCQRSTAAKEYECTHSTDAFGTDLGREFLVRSRRAAHRRKPHEHHEK